METKNEKFLRMLDVRLPKAVKAIELLANLSRKADYEWSAPQLQSMLDQLDDAVDLVAKSFGVSTSDADASLPRSSEAPQRPAGALSADPASYCGMTIVESEAVGDRLTAFALVSEARKIGDEELASATLAAIIDRWLQKEG